MAKYMVVAHTSYRGMGDRSYVCAKYLTKTEARRYMKENCYTTVSRTYTIEAQ